MHDLCTELAKTIFLVYLHVDVIVRSPVFLKVLHRTSLRIPALSSLRPQCARWSSAFPCRSYERISHWHRNELGICLLVLQRWSVRRLHVPPQVINSNIECLVLASRLPSWTPPSADSYSSPFRHRNHQSRCCHNRCRQTAPSIRPSNSCSGACPASPSLPNSSSCRRTVPSRPPQRAR